MTPEQRQIKELEEKVARLLNFMQSFESAATVAPNVAATIKVVAGNATLAGLADVSITSPSNGQNLEYESASGLWKNSTDNV